MRFIVDIDKTICLTLDGNYYTALAIRKHVEKINALYDAGHEIIYWTARGAVSGKDWSALTKQQLEDWGVRYTELWMNKPHYDVWVDDKAEWIF